MILESRSVTYYASSKMSGHTDVRERCVVVLGKSGAGKSTVANMLVGYDPMSPESPQFSVSKKVFASVTREVKDAKYEFWRNNTKYALTVIDTVGLFDTEAAGNDDILEKIEEYFRNHIIGVNLILFVLKKGRFTQEESKVFSFIRSKFVNEICPISALAITGCEADTAETREETRIEFRSQTVSREVAGQMQKGIYTVGFPPVKSMLPALQSAYKSQMEDDRNTLLDLVVESETVHLTKKLFQEKVKPEVKKGWLQKLCSIM